MSSFLVWKIRWVEKPSAKMRSPGETRIWRRESQFKLAHVELEVVAECGPHGDVQEASGKAGLEAWGSDHGTVIIPEILTPYQSHTYSERLPSLEIHGGKASPQPPKAARTEIHVSEPSSRAVSFKRKNPVQKNDQL